MAKFYGSVGYDIGQHESKPGIWTEEIVERQYQGDVISIGRRFNSGESINDDLSVSNKVSILADPYAMHHFHQIRWIEWMGIKWIVSEVSVEYPRLILSLGGEYHEQGSSGAEEASTSPETP